MSIVILIFFFFFGYDINMFKDEVCLLVEQGIVSCYQFIYVFCQYIFVWEWVCVECELERNDYLLWDQIGDLMFCEYWEND